MMSKSGVILGCSVLFLGFVADCMAQSGSATEIEEATSPEVNILETGVLREVTGYKGDVLGAEVLSISTGEDNVSQIIELSVPIDPDLADRVHVVSPSGKQIELADPVEISRDAENKKVGITLKLSKKTSLGFKIRLIDVPDE